MGLLCVLGHLLSHLWAPSAKGLGLAFCIPAPQMGFLKCGVDVWQLGTFSQVPRPGLERLPGTIRGGKQKRVLV